mmetsp:Transcript_51472/g.112042  ORF Transcript_51472/g.112042 Transcript_51472/m.112042 type:complete len:216 (+) Transcript_51472:999-1646(+)
MAGKVQGLRAVIKPSRKEGAPPRSWDSYLASCCRMVRAPTIDTFFKMCTVRLRFSGEHRMSQKGWGSRFQYKVPCLLIHHVHVMVAMKTSIMEVPLVSAVRPAVSKPETRTKIAPKRPKMMWTRCKLTANSYGSGATAGSTIWSTSNSKWMACKTFSTMKIPTNANLARKSLATRFRSNEAATSLVASGRARTAPALPRSSAAAGESARRFALGR